MLSGEVVDVDCMLSGEVVDIDQSSTVTWRECGTCGNDQLNDVLHYRYNHADVRATCVVALPIS